MTPVLRQIVFINAAHTITHYSLLILPTAVLAMAVPGGPFGESCPRHHGCPAGVLLERSHDIDSTRLQSFATHLDTKRDQRRAPHQ